MNHRMWRLAEYDFSPSVLGQYSNLKTIDGYENVIANPTVINYMTMTKDGIPRNQEPEEATESEAATATDTQAATATDTAAATSTDTSAQAVTGEPEQTTAPQEKPQTANKAEKRGKAIVTAGVSAAAVVCIALGAAIIRKKRIR